MTADEIVAICFGVAFVIFAFSIMGITFYLNDKKIKQRQEYLKTLNEHDKAIILEWTNMRARLFERKKQK